MTFLNIKNVYQFDFIIEKNKKKGFTFTSLLLSCVISIGFDKFF